MIRVEGLKARCRKTDRRLSQNPYLCEKKTFGTVSKDYLDHAYSPNPRGLKTTGKLFGG